MFLLIFQPECGRHPAKLRHRRRVMRTHPQAIPLAMITTRKSIHGFPLLSYMDMGLRLAALSALHNVKFSNVDGIVSSLRQRINHFFFCFYQGPPPSFPPSAQMPAMPSAPPPVAMGAPTTVSSYSSSSSHSSSYSSHSSSTVSSSSSQKVHNFNGFTSELFVFMEFNLLTCLTVNCFNSFNYFYEIEK